jgi:hypothetical protein
MNFEKMKSKQRQVAHLKYELEEYVTNWVSRLETFAQEISFELQRQLANR